MLRVLALSLGLIGLTSCQSNVRKECPNTLKNWHVGDPSPDNAVFNEIKMQNISKIFWNGQPISLEKMTAYLNQYKFLEQRGGSSFIVLQYEGYVDCRLLNTIRSRIDQKLDCGEVRCIENPIYR